MNTNGEHFTGEFVVLVVEPPSELSRNLLRLRAKDKQKLLWL